MPNDSLYQIDRTTLPNGLQVWAKERPGTGTVALALIVRVGTRVEDRTTAGISHFLEHLLFTGTERWDDGEIRQAIKRLGGFYNGWTGYEGTYYLAEVDAKHLGAALDWLAEIIFRSTLPPDKVERERRIIFQERGGLRSEILDFIFGLCDRLGIVYNLRREVMRRLFPGSYPEGAGPRKARSLSRLTRQQLLAHYRRYYVPNNMVLIAVGDAPSSQVFEEAERHFGGFPAGELPAPPPPPGPPPGRFISVRMRWPYWTDRALACLGARTVGMRDKDRYPLAVLGWMLQEHLRIELREKKGLVYDVDAINNEYSDYGYFVVGTKFDGPHLDTVLASIKQGLEDMKEGRFDDESLAHAKEALRRVAILEATGVNVEVAVWFTSPALYLRPDEPLPDELAEIEAVTREDVQRVARTYFRPENSYQAIFRPAFTAREALIGSAALAAAAPLAFWLMRRRRRS